MTIVPKSQALQRWDTLPENLREVLVSEHSVEILDRIAETEHIPVDRIPIISRIAGYVIMGFLHPEEVARELQEALKIDIKIAENVSKTLGNRLFAPYRSQLEKLYAPVTKESRVGMDLELEKAAFKTTEERKQPITQTQRPPVMMENIERTVAKEKEGEIKPALKPQPIQAQPKVAPKMLDEIETIMPVNLSGSMTQAREIPIPQPPAPKIQPAQKPIEPPKPAALSWEQKNDVLGIVEEIKKLERSGAELIGVLKKHEEQEVGATEITATPKISSFEAKTNVRPIETEKPLILHQELNSAPMKREAAFKIEAPSPTFEMIRPGEDRGPVRIEIGRQDKKSSEEFSKSEVIKPPKVVHYSSFQTPLERPANLPNEAINKPAFQKPAMDLTGKPVVDLNRFNKVDLNKPLTETPINKMPQPTIPKPVAKINYGADQISSLPAYEAEPQKKNWFKSLFGGNKKLTPEIKMPPTPLPQRPDELNKGSVKTNDFFSSKQDGKFFQEGAPKTADIKPQNISLDSKNLNPENGKIDLETLKKV